MKTIKLLLIGLIVLTSCSKDDNEDINEPKQIIPYCGELVQKRHDILNNCYEIQVKNSHNGGRSTKCIEREEFITLEVGQEYCIEGQFIFI